MVLKRYNCRASVLTGAIEKFHGKRVLVIGDMMLDRFVWGSVSRISPEAPVPVVEIRRESTCLGGAANVAANICSLGAVPVPLGVIGDDAEGRHLRDAFRTLGVPLAGLVVDKSRSTTLKTRIIAHHQQVCRTDREEKAPVPAEVFRRAVAQLRRHLPGVAAVVISDYAKGLITPGFLREILPLCKAAGKIVCVDPKMQNLSAYRPATVITPNTLEAEKASGVSIAGKRDLVRAGRKILKQTGIRHLLITRGEQGMALFEHQAPVTYIPTLAREVFDVTGAGDTVISTLALGLVAGLTIVEASILSNIAAGLVVAQLGTASVTPEELSARVAEMSADSGSPAYS